MLRPTYHLKIRQRDEEKFLNALKAVGKDYEYRISDIGEPEDSYLNYIVKLSKYELLYVRLATPVLDTVNVDEWNIKQEKEFQGTIQSDNVDTGV